MGVARIGIHSDHSHHPRFPSPVWRSVISRVEPEGGFLRGAFRFGLVALAVVRGEAHADGFRNTELFHRHAIHYVGAGHGALRVGDDDELRVVDEAVEHLDEAVDVRLVERGVELVEHAERAGLDHVDREQQRDGGHRALATG